MTTNIKVKVSSILSEYHHRQLDGIGIAYMHELMTGKHELFGLTKDGRLVSRGRRVCICLQGLIPSNVLQAQKFGNWHMTTQINPPLFSQEKVDPVCTIHTVLFREVTRYYVENIGSATPQR